MPDNRTSPGPASAPTPAAYSPYEAGKAAERTNIAAHLRATAAYRAGQGLRISARLINELADDIEARQ